MSSYDKDLIPLQNAGQLLDIWKDAKSKVEAAITLLRQAKQALGAAFGEHSDNVLPHGFCDYSLSRDCSNSDELPADIDALLKRHFWVYIVEKTEMRKVMSVKRREELDKQLYTDTASLPEPSEASLAGFLDVNLSRAHVFAKEAVDEVFQWLRPNREIHDFKSNARFEIGKKVCLNGVMDTRYVVRLSSCRSQNFHAMDNLFHMLDGKGLAVYPQDIVTIIDTACQYGQWSAETEYFRLKWYKKGSMHIEFKRLDLVAKLNEIAGGAALKCS